MGVIESRSSQLAIQVNFFLSNWWIFTFLSESRDFSIGNGDPIRPGNGFIAGPDLSVFQDQIHTGIRT